MSKMCANCGYELKESAKFCGKCGTKVDEIKKLKCRKCGWEPETDAAFCLKCGEPFEIIKQFGVIPQEELGKEKSNKDKGMNEHQKGMVAQYTDSIQGIGKGFVGDMKNYKTLPKKKKQNIIIALSGLVAVVVIVLILLIPGMSGVSDKVVSQAALQVAQQDFGYKLELASYDIVDSFTAKSTNLMAGKSFKAKVHLVIIEADAKDENGEVAETVKYAVSVVDPKKSGEYVSCSPLSQAEDCTDMENKEIEEMLRSSAAAYR